MVKEKTQVSRGTRTMTKVKTPSMCKVYILNDDFTPMEFVVLVLKRIFFKIDSDADRIMMTAHTKGKALVGEYTPDIAESKVESAEIMATNAGYPLKFEILHND